MQLVLSNNRVIAHGENYLAMGGTVINTVTGAKFENATVAECSGCPSDIDKVGYEYKGGEFIPCAPFGKGNNNGYFMEVCEKCATPRSSGIKIKGGLTCENLGELLWENATPTTAFSAQTISVDRSKYVAFIVVFGTVDSVIMSNYMSNSLYVYSDVSDYAEGKHRRKVEITINGVGFGDGETYNASNRNWPTTNYELIPIKIYGVKL